MTKDYLIKSLAGLERMSACRLTSDQRAAVRKFARHLACEWPDARPAVIGRFIEIGVDAATFPLAVSSVELRAALIDFENQRKRLRVLLDEARGTVPESDASGMIN